MPGPDGHHERRAPRGARGADGVAFIPPRQHERLGPHLEPAAEGLQRLELGLAPQRLVVQPEVVVAWTQAGQLAAGIPAG